MSDLSEARREYSESPVYQENLKQAMRDTSGIDWKYFNCIYCCRVHRNVDVCDHVAIMKFLNVHERDNSNERD